MVVANNEAGMFAMGGEGAAMAAPSDAGSSVAGAAAVPSLMVTRSTGTALKAAVDAAAEAIAGAAVAAGEAAPPPSAAQGGHESLGAAAAAHPELSAWPTVSLVGNADAFFAWEELNGMLQPSTWGEDGSARRKVYQRLARIHHPDRSTGSQERFQLLAFLYKRANFHFDPASEPGFQNEL